MAVGAIGVIIITGTVAPGVQPGDILANNATINSTITYDPNQKNNNSIPVSVVGSYANVYTTIDVPTMTTI